MSPTLILVVLLVTMVALVGLMVTLAVHANQVRLAAPLREAIGTLEQRLDDRRAALTSIEGEIAQRNQDRDRLAQLTTDVAVIREQRDSLLAEVTNMGAQREELAALERERADLVLAVAEGLRARSEAEAEVLARRAEMGRIEERLAEFKAAEGRIDELTRQRDDLEKQVGDLRALRSDSDRLRGEVEELVARAARMQSVAEADEARLEDARLRRQAEEQAAALAQATSADLRADLSAIRQGLADAREEVARSDALRAKTEAEVERMAGLASGEQSRLEEARQKRQAEEAAAAAAQTIGADLRTDLMAARRRLADAQDEAAQLEARAARGEAEAKRMEILAVQEADRLDELRRRASAAEAEEAVARATLAEARHGLSAAREALADAQESLALVSARKARAEAENAASSGGAAGPDGLDDLRKEPPLLAYLRREPSPSDLQEVAALRQVREHLTGVGLEYHPRTTQAFHTALKVNDNTQMTVLAGISGTGKSQLPRRYAEAIGLGFLPVPVQPRWDSPQDLMGFYNYIEGRYRATDLARSMWRMDRYRDGADATLGDRLLVVLLDEMNLARVEYYFSDFLSRLETRPPRGDEADPMRRQDAEIVLDVPVRDGRQTRIYPGRNVLFVGTMNEDESTQSLSDKVVDRANLLRFPSPRGAAAPGRSGGRPAAAPLSRAHWDRWHRTADRLQRHDLEASRAHIESLAGIMERLGRPIGHRLRAAMLEYVANYAAHEGETLDVRQPVADQLELRLLPKLRGVEVEIRAGELNDLASFARTNLGDAELAEAIDVSREASQGLGQFSWRGLARAV